MMDNSTVQVAMVGMTGAGKTVLISTLAMKMSQMADQGVFLAPMGDNRRQTLRYVQQNWQLLNSGQWPPSTPAGELIQLQWELTTKTNSATVRFADCAGQDVRAIFSKERFDINSLTPEQKDTYNYLRNANVLIFLINMEDVLGRSPKESLENSLDIDQMFYVLNQPTETPRKIALVLSQFDKYRDELKARYNDNLLDYLKANFPLLHGRYVQNPDFTIIPVAAVENTRIAIVEGNTVQVPVENFSSFNLQKLISWIAQSVDELAPILQSYQDLSQTVQEEQTTQNTPKTEKTTRTPYLWEMKSKTKTKTDIVDSNKALSVVWFVFFAVCLYIYYYTKLDDSQYPHTETNYLLGAVILGMLFLRNFIYGFKIKQVKANVKKWEDEKENQNENNSTLVTEKQLYFYTPLFTIVMSVILFIGVFYTFIAITKVNWLFCVLPTVAITLLYLSYGMADYFEARKIARSKYPLLINQRMDALKSSVGPYDFYGCVSYLLFFLVVVLIFLRCTFTPKETMFALSIIGGVFCVWLLLGSWINYNEGDKKSH